VGNFNFKKLLVRSRGQAIVLFTFLFLSNLPFWHKAAAAGEKSPSGLCILKSKAGGHGHGFIIGNTLFSSAHVFELADGKILCMQHGALVDISSRRSDRINIHPTFQNPLAQISGLDKQMQGIAPELAREVVNGISRPYDLATMSLTSRGDPLISDFVLDPSLDIAQSAEFQSPLGLAGVIRLREDGSSEYLRTINDLVAVRLNTLAPAKDCSSRSQWTFGTATAGSPLFSSILNRKILPILSERSAT
jgi:hypothetical protein